MTRSKIRLLIRAAVVAIAAFGLRLSTDQVAAIYGLTEAALLVTVKDA